jgi:hypothetical protein
MSDFSVGRKLLFGSAFRLKFTALAGLMRAFFPASGELARIRGRRVPKETKLQVFTNNKQASLDQRVRKSHCGNESGVRQFAQAAPENASSAIASGHHLVKRSGIFNANLPWHPLLLQSLGDSFKICG